MRSAKKVERATLRGVMKQGGEEGDPGQINEGHREKGRRKSADPSLRGGGGVWKKRGEKKLFF